MLGAVGAFGTLLGGGGGGNGSSGLPGLESALAGGRRDSQPLPWRVALGGGGGSVRLTYGAPRTVSTAEALRQRSLLSGGDGDDALESSADLRQYPMEARLSVLSESPSASWKLLSLRVRCSPKTGESDHQLAMNRKQMFDLHRIGERAMLVEEAVCRKENEGRASKDSGDIDGGPPSPIVPRPLLRLFEVTHAFALSIQMEILSSQAEAMRRGAWGGSISAIPGGRAGATSNECITVSPAHFFDQKGGGSGGKGTAADGGPAPIAVMAVHFWSCDDRHGSPRVGDLTARVDEQKGDNEEDVASSIASKTTQRRDDNFLPTLDRRGGQRLSLCIRAVPTVGLVVSLSGGSDLMPSASSKDNMGDSLSHHMERNVDKLLSSIQDPFQLSMSDALLAATVLCADRRCRAVVGALGRQVVTGRRLPGWIRLEVECGTISVAATLSYPSSAGSPQPPARVPAVLFRLACDSRTGRFVPVFPRPASLLRLLACNDPSASDAHLLRGAAASSAPGGGSKRGDGASIQSTGRVVRDAFEALSRSMDTLGRRCGVGGEWNDVDTVSSSLREKSIGQTCQDVRSSLVTCCGVAAVFGIGTMALKIAGGVDPVVDVVGGPINDESNPDLIRVPPLSVLLRQRIVEKLVKEGDGETKRVSQLQGELFALSAKVNEESLEFVCFDVLTMSESASSVPMRLKHAKVNPPEPTGETEVSDATRPTKRTRTVDESSNCHHTLEEVEHAAFWFDSLLRQ